MHPKFICSILWIAASLLRHGGEGTNRNVVRLAGNPSLEKCPPGLPGDLALGTKTGAAQSSKPIGRVQGVSRRDGTGRRRNGGGGVSKRSKSIRFWISTRDVAEPARSSQGWPVA